MMRLLVLVGLLGLLLGCGKNGKDGTPGAAGTTIQSGYGCRKTDAGSGTSLYLVYQTVLYSTGDRFVEIEISTDKTYSSSAIYRAGSLGATNGGASLNYNLPGDPTGAYWTATIQGSTAKFLYRNPGGAHDNYLYTFVTADCTAF